MKFKIVNIALTAFLVLTTGVLLAQAPPPPPPDTTAAIDSGALALVMAVGGYGYLRLKRKSALVN